MFSWLRRLSGDDDRSREADKVHAARAAEIDARNAELSEIEQKLQELGRRAVRSKRFSTTVGTVSSLTEADKAIVRSMVNDKAHSG